VLPVTGAPPLVSYIWNQVCW